MPALKRLGLDEVNKAVVIDTLGYKPEFLSWCVEIRVKEELIGRIILRHPQEYIKSYKKTLFGKIGVDKLAKDRGGSRWSFARLKVGRG